MKRKILLGLLLFVNIYLHAQTIEEYFEENNFEEVVKFENQEEKLKGEELYFIGYSFFRLEKDEKAVVFLTKAIEKDYKTAFVYLTRGIANRYLKKLEDSEEDLKTAVSIDELSQRYLSELGQTYFDQNKIDKAIETFAKARNMTFETGLSYLMLPAIYELKKEKEKALEEYYISADLIDKQDDYYLYILEKIGTLELLNNKNYDKALEYFDKILRITPNNTFIISNKIISLFAKEEYKKGNEIFEELKKKYFAKELSKEYMERGAVAIDKFNFKEDYLVITYKKFETPKELLDEIYYTYLYSYKEEKVLKIFKTEKSFSLDADTKENHLFCAKIPGGAHQTFPFGWKTKDIKYKEYKNYLLKVLNDKENPAAASNFSTAIDEKKEE
ncbi:tetratricopeptide repeat protein [Aureivirga marina]|uniref:tetratricopeptide repeat protein n=1 Tax=Aureivirga marina TaxID=1182451 RepID=UPI0018C9C004|nr:hypothetical protein [Aureivirga marina]